MLPLFSVQRLGGLMKSLNLLKFVDYTHTYCTKANKNRMLDMAKSNLEQASMFGVFPDPKSSK